MVDKTFGERLKALREDNDLKQKDLAEIIGVSDRTVGMYEQNRREPNIETLKKIANYFNVTLDYLLGREEYERFKTAQNIKDEIIEMMIRRGIIKNKSEINEEHLKLIEMSIKTYADKTKNRKDED